MKYNGAPLFKELLILCFKPKQALPIWQYCSEQWDLQPCKEILSPTELKIWQGKNNCTKASESAFINDNLRSEMYSKGIFQKSNRMVIRIACDVPRSFEKSKLWEKTWVLCTDESSKQFGKWQPKYGKQWLSYFLWRETSKYIREMRSSDLLRLCMAGPLFHACALKC